MTDVRIIWDVAEDPDGHVQHIAAHGITVEEVEDVLRDRDSEIPPAGPLGARLPSGTRHADAISLWSGNMSMTTR
jgi:hypothetical protein